MNKWVKARREERNQDVSKNPSFSSSLLDEIYRSFDYAVDKRSNEDLKSHRETTPNKQSKNSGKIQRSIEHDDEQFRSRELSIDKIRDERSAEKLRTQRRHSLTDLDRKSQHKREDALFFPSTSNFSDSNSGLYSSSENESLYGSKSLTPSNFRPQRPKPSWTSVSSRQEKTEREKQRSLFKKQKEFQVFDDYRCNSSIKQSPKHGKHIISSKSMDSSFNDNLKQPISPGARISRFLNSLFSTGSLKKKKKKNNPTSSNGGNEGKESNCSSASSLSISCLSKQSPSSREKMQNGVKRSVRFYPVSVILDEDRRPCGQKSLYEQDDSSPMAFSQKKPWKIVQEKEREFGMKERSQRVEEAVREYLKEYRLYQESDYDHQEGAESDSSSDLFELDHIAVMGRERSHQDELPVYETTNVSTNLAIANGLII